MEREDLRTSRTSISADEASELEFLREYVNEAIIIDLNDLENIERKKPILLKILSFVKKFISNQELLLKNDLLQKLVTVSIRLETNAFVERRIIYDIFNAVCIDDKDRREYLRNHYYEYDTSQFLSAVTGSEDAKKLNLDLLRLLEQFNQKLQEDGIKIYDKDMVVHEVFHSKFCKQMESAYDSAGGCYEIRELSASLAFQFTPSKVQSINYSKFYHSLLMGISIKHSPLYSNERRKGFFVALQNASKAVALITPSLDYRLNEFLECLSLPACVCTQAEVLEVINLMKTAIINNKESAEQVLKALCPLFTTTSPKAIPPADGDSSWKGDFREVCLIMQILCYVMDLDNDGLCNYIGDFYDMFSRNSLKILDGLIRGPTTELLQKDTKKYILLFHSKYSKKRYCEGEFGTIAVMSRVLLNSVKQYTTNEDTKAALAILNMDVGW